MISVDWQGCRSLLQGNLCVDVTALSVWNLLEGHEMVRVIVTVIKDFNLNTSTHCHQEYYSQKQQTHFVYKI